MKAISIGPRAQWALAFAAALAVLAGASLWWLVPAVAARTRRIARVDEAVSRADAARGEAARAAAGAATLAERELAWGDRLARIAFLYGVDPAHWPRALDPGRGLVSPAGSRRVEGLAAYAEALETARAAIADVEERDPGLAARTPSIVPVRGDLRARDALRPACVAVDGRRGVLLRASTWRRPRAQPSSLPPTGASCSRAGRGTRRPRGCGSSATLVVIAHGPENATLFGHLARIEVRTRRARAAGAADRDGGEDGLGAVAATPLRALAPARPGLASDGPALRDPRPPPSTRGISRSSRCARTSAPDSAESLPGLP